MGWVKGSDRNFEASQTKRYRKTKKDRVVERGCILPAQARKWFWFYLEGQCSDLQCWWRAWSWRYMPVS